MGAGMHVYLYPCENMMIRSSQLPQLDLARNKFDLPLLVDMEAFFEFSFWLAEELLELEAKYGSKHSSRLQRPGGKEAIA